MKYIKIIVIVFSIVFLGACKKSFLDSNLLTSKTDQNAYTTTKDAWLALVGCYDGLQSVWNTGGLPVFSEVMSDNCFGGTGATDGYGYQMIDGFDKTISPGDASFYEGNWIAYYQAIFRCNTFLTKMDQIDWGTSGLRGKYEAETRFIRAYLYFDMVRLWGHIPLLTKPTSDYVPQAEPDSVYKVIANDLKYAIDSLPEVSYASQPVSEHGRVTKWAAESLMARVYLYYTGYYSKSDLVGVITKDQALAYLENVISKSGLGLLDNFADLWPAASLNNYAGEDNKETVFAIKYTYTSDYNGNSDGNQWMVMTGIRDQSIYPYGNGWGACTVDPKLWNAFSDNDTRKVPSIISIKDENLGFQKKADQREYTGYYLKKYTPMCDSAGNSLAVKLGGVNFMIGQYEDYVSIRYSDVLLMAAELGSSNAQNYFDQVRLRAYADNFVSEPVSQAAIMNERRLEFAGEGIRYWDLLRQGMTVTANAINETATVENGGVSATVNITFNTATQGLSQIPNNQITLSNGTLVQNQGW
jgi:hypothetical protein